MTEQTKVKLADAPSPDMLIEYPDGSICALMFHFACEHHELRDIAREVGFDLAWSELDEEAEPALYRRYHTLGQGEGVVRDWQPPTPEGWRLAGKWDTEDGPTVYFIRKVEQAADSVGGTMSRLRDEQKDRLLGGAE